MQKIAGVLFFLAGVTIFMGIITAEIFYPPGYSISQDMISTLGASPPPHSVIKQPSAEIFDNTMMFSGIILLIGVCYFSKFHQKLLTTTMFLMGLGAVGVGVFPAFHPIAHPISALITFSFGGISAIISAKFVKPPFSYISLIFGIIALVFLFFGTLFPHVITPVLGIGGTERWVAYPIILWLIGFGGYLMNSSKLKV